MDEYLYSEEEYEYMKDSTLIAAFILASEKQQAYHKTVVANIKEHFICLVLLANKTFWALENSGLSADIKYMIAECITKNDRDYLHFCRCIIDGSAELEQAYAWIK
jgi:hypothetical protein